MADTATTEQEYDAYAEHVARLREQRAQDPEDEQYELHLSVDAVNFAAAACEALTAKTAEMDRGKRELESALISAVRAKVREQEARREGSKNLDLSS